MTTAYLTKCRNCYLEYFIVVWLLSTITFNEIYIYVVLGCQWLRYGVHVLRHTIVLIMLLGTGFISDL